MKLDPETHYPTISPREMWVCRVIAGILGGAFFIGVVWTLFTGEFTYGIYEWADGGRAQVRAHPGRATVSSFPGKLFAFLSFGMMGLGALAFAVRPKIFTNPKVIFALVALILAASVALRYSR